MQKRSRKMLRIKSGTNGSDCPQLEETKACDGSCLKHEWRTTEWSSCHTHSDFSSCGIGMRTRMSDCVRSDGKTVQPHHCQNLKLPDHLEKCSIPCATDCQLSTWTAWTKCENACDQPGAKTRSRAIIKEATNGGESCSQFGSLTETISCPILPCYKLEVGEWSICVSEVENGCGFASRTRNLTCIRSDGKSY